MLFPLRLPTHRRDTKMHDYVSRESGKQSDCEAEVIHLGLIDVDHCQVSRNLPQPSRQLNSTTSGSDLHILMRPCTFRFKSCMAHCLPWGTYIYTGTHLLRSRHRFPSLLASDTTSRHVSQPICLVVWRHIRIVVFCCCLINCILWDSMHANVSIVHSQAY